MISLIEMPAMTCSSAAWRPDGREVFYARLGDGQLMAAEVHENGVALEIGAVHALFGPIPPVYDISLDGQQFLTATAEEEASASEHLTVVQNWLAGIRK